jgi:hypothetical protein
MWAKFMFLQDVYVRESHICMDLSGGVTYALQNKFSMCYTCLDWLVKRERTIRQIDFRLCYRCTPSDHADSKAVHDQDLISARPPSAQHTDLYCCFWCRRAPTSEVDAEGSMTFLLAPAFKVVMKMMRSCLNWRGSSSLNSSSRIRRIVVCQKCHYLLRSRINVLSPFRLTSPKRISKTSIQLIT